MKLRSKKGFTLIELIIVIAILGIIALIAVPNLAGIRQRSQVSADKRTAEQIGKAVRIWLTDVDAGTRAIHDADDTCAKQYDVDANFPGLCDTYISKNYRAESLTNGGDGRFYVTSFAGGENNANEKIFVYIAKDGLTDIQIPSKVEVEGFVYQAAYDGSKDTVETVTESNKATTKHNLSLAYIEK